VLALVLLGRSGETGVAAPVSGETGVATPVETDHHAMWAPGCRSGGFREGSIQGVEGDGLHWATKPSSSSPPSSSASPRSPGPALISPGDPEAKYSHALLAGPPLAPEARVQILAEDILLKKLTVKIWYFA